MCRVSGRSQVWQDIYYTTDLIAKQFASVPVPVKTVDMPSPVSVSV
jgi:hypothetical protein